MVAKRVSTDIGETKPRRKTAARTLEARESQIVALAFDLVEERLRNGTATSQETTHFLKIGSSREKAERERLTLEIELTKAKTQALANGQDYAKVAQDAIDAMRQYTGADRNDYDE